MAIRRSPVIATLLLGICVFQLVLGGSGVLCAASSQRVAGAPEHSVSGPSEGPMPCHGQMPTPIKDTRSGHTPDSRGPSHSSDCQPMAACGAGFVPAVAQDFRSIIISLPST